MKQLALLFLLASAAQAGTILGISAQSGNASAQSTWTRYDWTTGAVVTGTPVLIDVAIIGQYSGMSAPHVVTFDGASTTLGGLAQKAWSGCAINLGGTGYSNNGGVVHVTMACTPAGLANGDSVISWGVTGAGAAAINNRAFAVANLSGAQFDLSGSTFSAAISGGITERPAALERLGNRFGANYGQVVIGTGNTLTVGGAILEDYQSASVGSRTAALIIANAGSTLTFACGFACTESQASNNSFNAILIANGTISAHVTVNGGSTPGDYGSFKISSNHGCGNHDLTYTDFVNVGGNNATDYGWDWGGTGNAGGGDATVAFSIMTNVTWTNSGGFDEAYLDGATYQVWTNVTMPLATTDVTYQKGADVARTTGVRTFTNVRITGTATLSSDILTTYSLFDLTAAGQLTWPSPWVGSGYNFIREQADNTVTTSSNTGSFYLLWDDTTHTNPHAVANTPSVGQSYLGPGIIAESTCNVASCVGIFLSGGAGPLGGSTFHNDGNIVLPNAFGDASFYLCIQTDVASGSNTTCDSNTSPVKNSFGLMGGAGFNCPCGGTAQVQNNFVWAPSGATNSPISCDAHGTDIANLFTADYNVKVNVTATSTTCGPFTGQTGGYIGKWVAYTPGVHDTVLSGTPPLVNTANLHFTSAMVALGLCSATGPTDTAGCLTALKANMPGIMPQLFWRIRSYVAPTKPSIWTASSTGTTSGAVTPSMFPMPGNMRTVTQ